LSRGFWPLGRDTFEKFKTAVHQRNCGVVRHTRGGSSSSAVRHSHSVGDFGANSSRACAGRRTKLKERVWQANAAMSSQLSPQQSGMKLPNQLSGYGVLSSPGQANPQHELAASAPLGPSAKTGHLSTASRSFPAPAVMQVPIPPALCAREGPSARNQGN
jgi:hypothetical protein